MGAHSLFANTVSKVPVEVRLLFFRQFKLHFGTTPINFIHAQRIEKGKEYLKYTKLSISEIGYRLGYSSPSYFASQFERIVKYSPTHYRKLKLYQN